MADPVAHIPPLAFASVRRAAAEACEEVERQDRLARSGKFGPNHTLPGGPDDARLRVLVEEVGEVAEALNEIAIGGGTRDDVRKELVQVAACAVAWVAAIDERRG